MVQEKAIEMFVGGLMLDPNTQAPVVVLKDESGEIILPIWIGVAEATSIASAIKKLAMARPLTHDLMYDALNQLGARIERVMITELKESTYYAELAVSVGERALILDARPSDAIALALRASAPIFVTQSVLDQAKVNFAAAGGPAGTQKGEGEGGETSVEGQSQEEQRPSEKDFANIDKDKWEEILSDLDPDDFKYKM